MPKILHFIAKYSIRRKSRVRLGVRRGVITTARVAHLAMQLYSNIVTGRLSGVEFCSVLGQ